MTISEATANLSLLQARQVAQRLANQTGACHIIRNAGEKGQGYVVVDARQVTADDLDDSVDYAYPTYGEV